jgi:RNA polymerase sigma factor (sigma-70 family)
VKTSRIASRFLGGRALRLQPDGRLVSLVRAGYESAFEEIFRRYGAPLRSYAASIVSASRADDVTQEAFTKAYLALRGTDKEIQLRPWLYRIVRNTALTDIRDEPRPGVELDEAVAAGMTPEQLAEQREDIRLLMAGLRELPEPQRAAIVMRELEGLSHEQISASLGLSSGAVRQSIYRARRALRDGIGVLLPMPFLRLLLEEGFTQGASAAAAGGGAGIAVKAGVAAVLAAGTVTTGAVLNHELRDAPDARAKVARTVAPEVSGQATEVVRAVGSVSSGRESGDDSRRHHGPGGGSDDRSGHSGEGRSGSGHSGGGSSGSEGPGSSGSGHSGDGGGGGGGPDSPGTSGSGSSGSGSGTSGGGSGGSGGAAGSDLSGSGSGHSGSGSGDGSEVDGS